MSTSKSLEYGIRWPNGSLLPLKYSSRHEAQAQRNQVVDTLKRLGVPEVYYPQVKARLMKVETSEWLAPTEAEFLMGADDDELVDP